MKATKRCYVSAWLAAICVILALPAVRGDEPARSVEKVPGRGFASWVMLPDNRTLIVSPTDVEKLIYFDTVLGKKTQEIPVDRPHFLHGANLALRGNQLVACVRGDRGSNAQWLTVLDRETGRQVKRIRVVSEKSHRLISLPACHPTKGLVYVSDYNHQILSVNPESGAVHRTKGWGWELHVDPEGKFLYAGTGQLSKEQAAAWGMDPPVKFDPKTTRTTIVKYAIEGDDLTQVAVNRNVCEYSRNGYPMRLSADGQCIGMIGSGTRGAELTLVSTHDLMTVKGRTKGKLKDPLIDFALHPVLDLGVLQTNKSVGRRGETETSLLLFKPSTMEIVDTIALKGGSVFPILLAFGGRGTKLISAHYTHDLKPIVQVEFIPLKLSDADRAALEKAYGKR